MKVMVREVRLPEISEDVKTGEVVNVLVAVGDDVDVDQPLVELETEKAVFELPSPYKGKVTEILVKKGDSIQVGQIVLKMETADQSPSKAQTVEPASGTVANKIPPAEEQTKMNAEEEAPPAEAEPQKTDKTKKAEALAVPGAIPQERPATPLPAEREKEIKAPLPASPAVRRLARELEVDLRQVQGSGPGERILETDVKKFAAGALESGRAAKRAGGGEADAWGPIEREPMSKVRIATARSMGRAWATIPQVTQYDRADITELENLMKRHAPRVEEAGGKLTITSILLKMAASALRVFPQLNASVDVEKEEVVFKKYYHIGVAVDTDRGLIVPVVRDVDQKNVTELAIELGNLARKAREKKISPAELEGGTFTISNLGGIGGTAFSPIVYPPQVGILGVSRARLEPVYRDQILAPRRILPLSVTYDHRLVDGADGARFLKWIVEAIEEPFMSLLEG